MIKNNDLRGQQKRLTHQRSFPWQPYHPHYQLWLRRDHCYLMGCPYSWILMTAFWKPANPVTPKSRIRDWSCSWQTQALVKFDNCAFYSLRTDSFFAFGHLCWLLYYGLTLNISTYHEGPGGREQKQRSAWRLQMRWQQPWRLGFVAEYDVDLSFFGKGEPHQRTNRVGKHS